MNPLYLKYSIQQPRQFYLGDSQRLHFGVTIASSLHFKESPLLRGSGSSSILFRKFRFLGYKMENNYNMNDGKLFFETQFLALQALHFHFQINKSKNRKGFPLVTPEKIKPDLLHQRNNFVTRRNSSVTNRL